MPGAPGSVDERSGHPGFTHPRPAPAAVVHMVPEGTRSTTGQAGKLAALTGDLRRRVSATGDGKRIASGFSYLGAESAIAWVNACRDHLYPVMKQSIESFDRRWWDARPILAGKPYHYVSLGPGDGQKDAVILRDLVAGNSRSCYVAVDMSAEMLRIGVHDLIRALRLPRSRILSVQLDFSAPDNLAELRRLLDGLFGAEPVLFSLSASTVWSRTTGLSSSRSSTATGPARIFGSRCRTGPTTASPPMTRSGCT